MALITCPECNHQVSSAAPSCPKCGFPVASSIGERVAESAAPSLAARAAAALPAAAATVAVAAKLARSARRTGSAKTVKQAPSERLKHFVHFLVAKKRIISKCDLERALRLQMHVDRRIGRLAIMQGMLSPDDVMWILRTQASEGGQFGEIAERKGLLTAEQVDRLVGAQQDPLRLFVECLIACRLVREPEIPRLLQEFSDQQQEMGDPEFEAIARTTSQAFDDGSYHVDAALLRMRLKALNQLSALPQAVAKALSLLADPEIDFDCVAKVIKGDMGLTTRLLRMANSVYYGRRTKCTEITPTLVTLGRVGARNCVLAASIMDKFKGINPGEARDLWRHGHLAAVWARRLVEQQQYSVEVLEDAFIGGLVHDVGRLAIWQSFPEATDEIQKLVDQGTPLLAAESEVLDISHPEVGAYLCRAWSFPPQLGQAVMYHHANAVVLDRLVEHRPTTRAVNAACRLAHLTRLSDRESDEQVATLDVDSLDREFLEFHGLDPADLVEQVDQVARSARQLFDVLG